MGFPEKKSEKQVEKQEETTSAALHPSQREEFQQMMRDLIKEMMPAMAALIATSRNEPAPIQMGDTRPGRVAAAMSERALNAQECHECRQKLHACEGKHALMLVYPERYPEFAQYYQGVSINGVRYLSTNRADFVTVPKAAAGAIMADIERFTTMEREARLGKDNSAWTRNDLKMNIARQLGLAA